MKNCAVFNDISGFGNCSLSAQLPVLCALGVRAHPAPTAVLSNQTAYGEYEISDMSGFLRPCIERWRRMERRFDGILTGFFTCEGEVDAVLELASSHGGALLVADPVMGDNGAPYSGFSDALCKKIGSLACRADVITPNKTELRMLAGTDDMPLAAEIMLERGCGAVVLTGVEKGGMIGSTVFTPEKSRTFLAQKRGGYFSGTGDIFSAVLTGMMLRGADVFSAAERAGEFVSRVIACTDLQNAEDGIDFEKRLGDLIEQNN